MFTLAAAIVAAPLLLYDAAAFALSPARWLCAAAARAPDYILITLFASICHGFRHYVDMLIFIVIIITAVFISLLPIIIFFAAAAGWLLIFSLSSFFFSLLLIFSLLLLLFLASFAKAFRYFCRLRCFAIDFAITISLMMLAFAIFDAVYCQRHCISRAFRR